MNASMNAFSPLPAMTLAISGGELSSGITYGADAYHACASVAADAVDPPSIAPAIVDAASNPALAADAHTAFARETRGLLARCTFRSSCTESPRILMRQRDGRRCVEAARRGDRDAVGRTPTSRAHCRCAGLWASSPVHGRQAKQVVHTTPSRPNRARWSQPAPTAKVVSRDWTRPNCERPPRRASIT